MSGKVFVRRSRASKCERGKYDSRRVSGSNLTPQSVESSCFRTYVPYLKIFTLSPLPFLKVVGVIVFHPLCVCVCVCFQFHVHIVAIIGLHHQVRFKFKM